MSDQEHRYGYVLDDEGQLVTGSCTTGAGHATCLQETSHQCHGKFLCIQCLSDHAKELQAAGQTATFVGQLNRKVEDTDADA